MSVATSPLSVAPRGLLELLRLGSAALPIGSFAYSQGMETACSRGLVHDAASTSLWVEGILSASVLTFDVPILSRVHAALLHDDLTRAAHWNALLHASRTTSELRAEEAQVGGSLLRLVKLLGSARAAAWSATPTTLAAAFVLAALDRDVDARSAALAYAFAWSEQQVGAATRLVPLGQTDAQRVLSFALDVASAGIDSALSLGDDELSATTFGQSMLSAWHEEEYSRLFRS